MYISITYLTTVLTIEMKKITDAQEPMSSCVFQIGRWWARQRSHASERISRILFIMAKSDASGNDAANNVT